MPPIDENIRMSIGANLPGVRLDPYQSSNFIIEIAGVFVAGFSDCTGLYGEMDARGYREGGLQERVGGFGPTRHPPLVLKHGLSAMDGLWSWHQDVMSGAIERRSGTIYRLNQAQLPVVWWKIRDAIPLKWNGPELHADAATVVFDSVEIGHRGLVRSRRSTAETAVAIATSQLATR